MSTLTLPDEQKICIEQEGTREQREQKTPLIMKTGSLPAVPGREGNPTKSASERVSSPEQHESEDPMPDHLDRNR